MLRDVYLSENTLIFNSSHASNIEYINVLYETQKQSNLNMFTYFSQHEKTFEASLRNKMRDVFYSNVCVSSALNVNCTRGDVDISKVLVKGMKYVVDYYANQIDYLKIQYNTAIDDGTNLFIGISVANVGLSRLRFTKDNVLVLVGRFVIAPLLMLIIVKHTQMPQLMKQVFILQSAMPVMTNAPVVAKLYGADADYAAIMVTESTLLTLLVVPILMSLVSLLG